jgi:hypothetical protein
MHVPREAGSNRRLGQSLLENRACLLAHASKLGFAIGIGHGGDYRDTAVSYQLSAISWTIRRTFEAVTSERLVES